METLISICENKNTNEDLKVGVVHALNVLRALFRCSQLGDLVGPFVSRAIDISIVLFNSSSWPVSIIFNMIKISLFLIAYNLIAYLMLSDV